MSIKLSAYIVTLNEEARLPRTLEAVKQVADEIIVVDSGSTDKTEEIAKKYGCKFMFHKWKNISSQKRFAQEQCENDYLIRLDADEVLSPKLIEEIKEIKKNPEYQLYVIKHRDMYPGDTKPKLFADGDESIRIYDRRIATMPDDLTHDRVVVLKEGIKSKKLEGLIYHYSYLNLYQFWYKLNMYTDELVKTAVAQGKTYSRFRLVIEMPYQFIRYYFFRMKFIQGLYGFIISVSLAYFRFLRIAKWFEYQKMNNKK